MPYLTPRAADPHPGYLALVDAALEGDDTFERKREVIDEYGWRHFGEIYGDHEAVRHDGPTPLVSHYAPDYSIRWALRQSTLPSPVVGRRNPSAAVLLG